MYTVLDRVWSFGPIQPQLSDGGGGGESVGLWCDRAGHILWSGRFVVRRFVPLWCPVYHGLTLPMWVRKCGWVQHVGDTHGRQAS